MSRKPLPLFTRFAQGTARAAGRPSVFMLAVTALLAWGASGPAFGFSDSWQLVVNTGTTIVTFLMVFLIQNTQNRDAEALHVKLDELIRCTQGARNALMDLEKMEDDEIERLRAEYEVMADCARGAKVGGSDAVRRTER